MEQLQFKISSALKDLVGKDLIINDNVAIFELVKNAYDAYATKVEIEFLDDRIVISDNGKGMTFEDLRDKWLFVGFSAKKDGTEDNEADEDKQKSYRDKIKRHYAGAKGIGRFSCDRLGKELLLKTKNAKSNILETIQVNWTDFEADQYVEFERIDIGHESSTDDNTLFPEHQSHGTILEISRLNDEKLPWTRKRLLELKHSLEKLINPFAETNDFSIEIKCPREQKEDDKCREKGEHGRKIVNGVLTNSITRILTLKTTQIDVKLFGGYIYTTLSDRGVEMYKIRKKNESFHLLTDVRVNLYYLNRSAKSNFTRLMGIEPVNYGSIFLFRNGFRIMPFGNTGDDSWGLDYRAQQGRARYLGTRDLFGRVDVITDNIEELKEVSSRDGGLIETPTSSQLFQLFTIAHRRLERYVSGVLWGGSFVQKEYFKDENEALAQRHELLEADKEFDTPDYIMNSSLGSKIDFVQLIKTLTRDKNVEVLSYNKDLANLFSDVSEIEQIKPQFIGDLEKIAETTNDDTLLSNIKDVQKYILKLRNEKEQSERRAAAEEQKRKEAEQKALEAEERRKEAERRRAAEAEAKRIAQIQAKEAELKRREEEIKRKEAEQKQKEEEAKRVAAENEKKMAESKLEKKTEQLKIVTSLSSQDIESSTNLHHQINVVADNIGAMITHFSRGMQNKSAIPYKSVVEFINNIALENSKIIGYSRFGIKKIFDDFTSKKQYNIIEYVKNYIDKIATQFVGGSRIKIIFEDNAGGEYLTKFAPIDISVIVDNMASNAKKAGADKLKIITTKTDKGLQIIFVSNKPFSHAVGNLDDIFELGYSTTNSTGVGLYHVKSIADENNWRIYALRKPQDAEFVIEIPSL